MDAGDGETLIVHYALQKLHILPSEFLNMEQWERAIIIASIKERAEAEEKETKRLKKQKGKGRK